jgi:hypothetical protein
VADDGFFGRIFKKRAPEPRPAPAHEDLEQRLSGLLDDLGSAHRKPFVRE